MISHNNREGSANVRDGDVLDLLVSIIGGDRSLVAGRVYGPGEVEARALMEDVEILLGSLKFQLHNGWLYVRRSHCFQYGLLPSEAYKLYRWLQEQHDQGRLRDEPRKRGR